MKRARTYMRMSTDKQEHSIESQWRLIKDYADRNGYIIDGKYVDEGISGKAAERRPAFMQMVDDSASGEFEYVLIYDSSRFARNLKDAIVYKSLLKQNGVELISITEPIVDEDTSLITDALLGAMNEMYLRKLSKNVKRGLTQKVLRGEMLNNLPFGYRRTVDGVSVEIVDEEAKIVRYLFSEFLKGRSAYALSRELALSGLKTHRGNAFNTGQVDHILQNPTYKGSVSAVVDGDEICVDGAHPAIIDATDFDEVTRIIEQRKLHRPKYAKPIEVHAHWLSGKIRCAKCGGTYYYRKNRNSTRNKSPQFLCINYVNSKCERAPVISEPILEELFYEALSSFSSSDDAFCEKQIVVIKKPVTIDFDALQSKCEKALTRAKEAYLAGIDTLEEYKANKDRLEAEGASIEQQRRDVASPTIDPKKVKKRVEGVLGLLKRPDATLDEKRRAIENTVEQIVIYPDRSITVIFYS